MKSLVWFREDLRVQDHQGLFDAQQRGEVIGLYILTPQTWRFHDRSSIQIQFLLGMLKELSQALLKYGIPLKILSLKTFEDIPRALVRFCQTYEMTDIYASISYGWDERERDKACFEALKKEGIRFHRREDFVVMNPRSVMKKDGSPYLVFTPYKRAWIQACLETHRLSPVQGRLHRQESSVESDPIPAHISGFDSPTSAHQSWVVSEKKVHDQLDDFLRGPVLSYADTRDFPSIAGTSRLSPYLALGVITPVQILRRLLELQGEGDFLKLLGKKSIEVFVGELVWRDFYQMVLYQFPHVSKHQPFKLETRHLRWTSGQTADHYFKAWAEGKTGFPIVDAAMRCLHQTGYMHNRLRMVTAMFFSKLLHLDWRRGEQYFMQHLIDGELGANNGGWQWCASTGTDAVPYFRIFNPTTQSQRFDADGHFIRAYLPELAGLSSKAIHDPSLEARRQCGYPEPIIDYVAERKRALSMFKQGD